MIYINFIVILIFASLAVLSRKHFSKYKADNLIKRIFLGMGDTVYGSLSNRISHHSIKKGIRKLHIVSPKKLDQMVDGFVREKVAICLGTLFISNLIIMIWSFVSPGKSQQENIIEREGYEGEVIEQSIIFQVDGREEIYTLQVSPVKYTEEEFYNQANAVFQELKSDILGGNSSLDNIQQDLTLQSTDRNGVFEVEWYSNRPSIISSTGRLMEKERLTDEKVVLTATLFYQEYTATYEYELIIKKTKGKVDNSVVNDIGAVLDDLEKECPYDKRLILPQEIEGVRIRLKETEKNVPAVIIFFTVVICVAVFAVSVSRLKEAGEKRDNMLKNYYPVFVNKLWLLMGAGLTIKGALREIAGSGKKSILDEEIEYMLREIETGCSEEDAYEQLGARLGIPAYIRLMNHISQSLRMGGHDIFRIMEEEIYLSLEARKELAKKQGEEASGKALFPMIILMAVIMVIVIAPAVNEF